MQLYKCAYFSIKELVSPIVYNKWGEQAWMFFNHDVLQDLDMIRQTWGSSIIINNWATGGNLKQCGLRSNMDDMVKEKTSKGILYLSSHALACGFDLHAGNGLNNKLWSHCYQQILHKKLKAFKRLEDLKLTNGWVHIDAFQASQIVFN